MRSLDWFRSQFPDCLYPTAPERQVEYVERVLTGFEIASRSSVIIGGLARDCERVLPATLARLSSLSNYFFDVTFCFFENDSLDQTREILIDWCSGNPDSILQYKDFGIKKHGSVKTEERIRDMVFCRTKLKKMIERNAEDGPPDYVILLDMDIEGGFSTEGLLNSLSYPHDCLASNSLIYEEIEGKTVRHYYDSYGLKLLNENRGIEEENEEKNRLLFHRGESPVKVASAFGGLALYKYSAYEKAEYGVGDWTRYCEHIPFHSSMECYLNPSQITLYSKTRYSI